MNRPEFAIVVIMRFLGASGLLAIPAVFLPFSWMDGIHRFMGLGDMPDVPIVHYLARSVSAFYAIAGTFTLFISSDVQRYHSFVKLWAFIVTVTGLVLLGIDLTAGMPTSWTIGEGPLIIAIGIVSLWLQRHITVSN